MKIFFTKIIPILFFLSSYNALIAQQALNVTLFDQYHRGDERYSGSWAYIAPNGSEYALLGAKTGTAIYTIDNAPIQEVAFIPGPSSNWREITVVGQHAYVTTEGSGTGEGMQVIDLSELPNSASLLTTYSETFTRGHIIQRDVYSDEPYVYVNGTSSTSGIHIMDISDPANPVEVGLYQPGYYIHDCHVKGDRIYAAAFYEGTIDIIDISDKSTPTLLAQIEDPGGNTHSSWLTEDNRYLFVCDELDGLPARIFNVEDINNPFQVATYTANSESLVHNPYIRGNLAIISHNTEGLRIVDLSDPTIPVEVGYYDTYDGPSGGFSGLWSACPFFPSGKIIGGNREDGLYVWIIDDAETGRFYGKVVDSLTNLPIFNAQIVIPEKSDTLITFFDGEFKGGYLPSSFTLEITADDYLPKTISVDLQAGDSLYFEVQLTKPEVVSTQTVPGNSNFKLYPNPAKDVIWIEGIKHGGILEVYDALGKRVKVLALNVADIQEFKLDGLNAGEYFYRFEGNDGKVISGKMSVQ